MASHSPESDISVRGVVVYLKSPFGGELSAPEIKKQLNKRFFLVDKSIESTSVRSNEGLIQIPLTLF